MTRRSSQAATACSWGPYSSEKERADFRERIRADPRNYIAQPVVTLSTCPTWTDDGLAPRHVDLRPYIVSGKSTWVLPGGLTRTALVPGSLVVNSSQGGGSKDTWVLAGPRSATPEPPAVPFSMLAAQSAVARTTVSRQSGPDQ